MKNFRESFIVVAQHRRGVWSQPVESLKGKEGGRGEEARISRCVWPPTVHRWLRGTACRDRPIASRTMRGGRCEAERPYPIADHLSLPRRIWNAVCRWRDVAGKYGSGISTAKVDPIRGYYHGRGTWLPRERGNIPSWEEIGIGDPPSWTFFVIR